MRLHVGMTVSVDHGSLRRIRGGWVKRNGSLSTEVAASTANYRVRRRQKAVIRDMSMPESRSAERAVRPVGAVSNTQLLTGGGHIERPGTADPIEHRHEVTSVSFSVAQRFHSETAPSMYHETRKMPYPRPERVAY